MFGWISKLFMGSTADLALGAAIYSVDLASTGGMHQMREPESVRCAAKMYKSR